MAISAMISVWSPFPPVLRHRFDRRCPCSADQRRWSRSRWAGRSVTTETAWSSARVSSRWPAWGSESARRPHPGWVILRRLRGTQAPPLSHVTSVEQRFTEQVPPVSSPTSASRSPNLVSCSGQRPTARYRWQAKLVSRWRWCFRSRAHLSWRRPHLQMRRRVFLSISFSTERTTEHRDSTDSPVTGTRGERRDAGSPPRTLARRGADAEDAVRLAAEGAAQGTRARRQTARSSIAACRRALVPCAGGLLCRPTSRTALNNVESPDSSAVSAPLRSLREP